MDTGAGRGAFVVPAVEAKGANDARLEAVGVAPETSCACGIKSAEGKLGSGTPMGKGGNPAGGGGGGRLP